MSETTISPSHRGAFRGEMVEIDQDAVLTTTVGPVTASVLRRSANRRSLLLDEVLVGAVTTLRSMTDQAPAGSALHVALGAATARPGSMMSLVEVDSLSVSGWEEEVETGTTPRALVLAEEGLGISYLTTLPSGNVRLDVPMTGSQAITLSRGATALGLDVPDLIAVSARALRLVEDSRDRGDLLMHAFAGDKTLTLMPFGS